MAVGIQSGWPAPYAPNAALHGCRGPSCPEVGVAVQGRRVETSQTRPRSSAEEQTLSKRKVGGSTPPEGTFTRSLTQGNHNMADQAQIAEWLLAEIREAAPTTAYQTRLVEDLRTLLGEGFVMHERQP